MIKLLRLSCLLAPMMCCPSLALSADNLLSVEAKESTARLEPRDAKQRLVALPALEVAVLTTLECPAGAKAESLTVSVSDTHQYFDAELLTDVVSLEAALKVPANQLAPIVIPEFCISGDSTNNKGLGLPGIATAQVSLRCRGEGDSMSVHFSSAPVPVRLYCQPDGDSESSVADR